MITKKHSKQSGENLFEVMEEFIKPVPKNEKRCVVLLYVDNHTFKKKVEGLGYKVIDVGNGLIADYNISVSNFKQEFNDVFSIINKDRGNMKIDYIITNPPYNKTLYLDILEYLIKNCSESEIVSVNPNQHLTDVISSSGFRKKRNTFKKYEESVYKHIKDKKYYNREEFEKLFNIEYAGSGAIYHISPKGKFSVYKTAFQETNKNGFVVHSVLIKILNKAVSEDVLSKHYKFHEKGNLIAVGEVCRAFEHGNLLYEKHKKVYNSKNEYFNNYGGNNLENKKDEGRRFINFNTSEEAQNFITCFDTEFMKFFMRSTHHDVAPLFNFIPLLDMTQKWTNEKLCEYYNVSEEEFKMCLEWFNN